MEKIKLVVINENMLGYIDSHSDKYAGILNSSVLRGSSYSSLNGPYLIGYLTKVRMASEKDFEELRVSFEGYDNSTVYEYLVSSYDMGKMGIDDYLSKERNLYLMSDDAVGKRYSIWDKRDNAFGADFCLKNGVLYYLSYCQTELFECTDELKQTFTFID